MEKRKLGKTDLLVSVIGFGAWGIGGQPFWETGGDDVSESSIRRAYDLGINFFDTAPVYGFGHSEEILGKALKSVRDKVIIATKCGLRWTKKDFGGIIKNSSKKSIKEEIDLSLKRLQTEQIDLYQVHWPDENTIQRETMEALLEIQSVGKIRYIGVSNYSISRIKESMEWADITSLQTEYNLLQRSIEQKVIPFCHEHQIGVLGYSPLASGVLCGKYNKNSHFKDWRGKGHGKIFSGKNFERSIAKVEKLKEIAKNMDKSCTQIAINWIVAKRGITCAIVGVKNEDQIVHNVDALGWNLDSNSQIEIDRIFGKESFI